MLLIQLLAFALTAGAADHNMLFSSYCSGILEQQIASYSTSDLKSVNASLAKIDKKAKAFYQINQVRFDDAQNARLDGYKSHDEYVMFDSKDAAMIRPGVVAAMSKMFMLKNIPERLAEVDQHLNSVMDGVVAGAVEVVGTDAINKYLEDLEKIIARNDAEIQPKLDRLFPYLTAPRIIGHSLQVGVPTAYLTWLGTSVVGSLIANDPSVAQLGLAAVSAAGAYFGRYLIFEHPLGYARGFVSRSARDDYQNSYGSFSYSGRSHILDRIRFLAREGSKRPNALMYHTEELILSENEVLDLKAKLNAKSAPGDDFVRSQESRPEEEPRKRRWLPVTYRLKLDLICHYDVERKQEVLIVVDRVIRQTKAPRRTKSNSNRDANVWSGWGALAPEGV